MNEVNLEFLKITVRGNEIRCKYCDIFYVKEVEYYGPSNDKMNRINQIRFVCPYCAEKGIQKVKFSLVAEDKMSIWDITEQFTEEMQKHQKMESLIVQIIQEISKCLGSDAKSPRHYIDYLYSQKMPFYGDFIYSTTLQRPPDPIAHLNSAISFFEGIESGHCLDVEKQDWFLNAISCLNELQKELRYTHRNLY